MTQHKIQISSCLAKFTSNIIQHSAYLTIHKQNTVYTTIYEYCATYVNKLPTAVNKHEIHWGTLNIMTKQLRLETDLNVMLHCKTCHSSKTSLVNCS